MERRTMSELDHPAARGPLELLNDRLRKHGWYDSAEYWNLKARSYAGIARSAWPSNRYNAETQRLQLETIERVLGDVSGKRILDLGCGTGRIAIELAARGASVIGWDFAADALAAARCDASARNLEIEFRQVDIRAALPDVEPAFDVVVTVSCLVLACRSGEEFEKVVRSLRAVCHASARLLLLEPIHSSRLLRRILKMSEREWIARMDRLGFELEDRGALSFLPARYLLAFHDAPERLVKTLFWSGERLLAKYSALAGLGDYKWHLYRVSGARPE
jgi:SAM-dependent methyltransferase